jgi:hypothetical protein
MADQTALVAQLDRCLDPGPGVVQQHGRGVHRQTVDAVG